MIGRSLQCDKTTGLILLLLFRTAQGEYGTRRIKEQTFGPKMDKNGILVEEKAKHMKVNQQPD
jgi:hypothetical protein